MPPPSMIVFVAPEPISFKFTLMTRFSVYVAAAIMTESPDEASEIACPMVLQAVWADMQLLLSLPLTPFTYHVVLAIAVEARASTTWYVNGVSGSDSNNCMSAQTACKTIGHAISLASSGDSVMIAAATYTENLVIRVNLKLIGSGATKTIIDGGGIYRVITIVDTAANVTLSKVTIRNGVEAFGGGIISSSSGTLTVTNSTISGNSAANSYSNAFGGAIYNSGTLTINNSTLNG